jgi:hypothetical protein
MIDIGRSIDHNDWAGAVNKTVDVAGNSIVKNLVRETSSIWAPKKEVSTRFWIRSRPQDF